MNHHAIMANNQDVLIRIDSQDKILGGIDKIEAHRGKGVLHRAISVALVNQQDQVLLAKRSSTKPLWPEFWDLSCSTHPWYPQESAIETAVRRLPFELGLQVRDLGKMEDIFSYEYHAVYSPEWSENEINHLVVGRFKGSLQPNPTEVDEVRWVDIAELTAMVAADDLLAPWVGYTIASLTSYVKL